MRPIHVLSTMPLILGAALPALATRTAPEPVQSTPPVAGLPAAGEGFVIAGDAEGGPPMIDVVNSLEAVTGVHVHVLGDTLVQLQRSSCGLQRPLEISAANVWPVVEELLARNNFIIGRIRTSEPAMITIHSLNTQARNTIRQDAHFVAVEDLHLYEDHPALLVSTILYMPHTDVRTLSNSMRTMLTDANTQQIIPVANSNALILTGFGPNVVALARALEHVDELSAKAAADRPPAEDTEDSPQEK